MKIPRTYNDDVDKTPLALRLIEEGTHYFLSRPRRFGKSLFLETLAGLFEGNRELFTGLAAEAHWGWRTSPQGAHAAAGRADRHGERAARCANRCGPGPACAQGFC